MEPFGELPGPPWAPALARVLRRVPLGARASLVIQSPQGSEAFPTRVEDLDGGRLAVAAPSGAAGPVLLRRGEAVLLHIAATQGLHTVVRGAVVDQQLGCRPPVVLIQPLQAAALQRRRHFRVETGGALATCAFWWAPPGQPGRWLDLVGRMIDLGGGGAGLRVDQPLAVGQRLYVRFDLPGRQGPWRGEARVAYVTPLGSASVQRYRVGLAFDSLDGPGRERLVRALHRYQLARRREARHS